MRIKEVEYIKDYILKIIFSNNVVKVVDLENMIKRSSGIFLPLKDPDYFKQVALDDCELSICWPNGADICPDVLYEMGTVMPKKKHATSKTLPKRHKRTSAKTLLTK